MWRWVQFDDPIVRLKIMPGMTTLIAAQRLRAKLVKLHIYLKCGVPLPYKNAMQFAKVFVMDDVIRMIQSNI